MNDPIAALLVRQPFIVLDGALATELERHGANLHDSLWSAKMLIQQPEMIRAVHLDYFAAGADVATTATYQASFEGFARRGIDRGEAVQLMRNAVTLATEARDIFWSGVTDRSARQRPLVAASLGPYGAMLADGSEYRGHYAASDRELREFHAPRIDALLDSGCDLFACETIPCLREAVVLAQLLEERMALSAWMSFSCANGRHNCEGESMQDCVAELAQFASITAIGVNCTRPRYIAELLDSMQCVASKPLLIYPNSGESYDPIAKHWHDTVDAASLGAQSHAWYAAGARLLGGCCRTTPADIQVLHQLREQLMLTNR